MMGCKLFHGFSLGIQAFVGGKTVSSPGGVQLLGSTRGKGLLDIVLVIFTELRKALLHELIHGALLSVNEVLPLSMRAANPLNG